MIIVRFVLPIYHFKCLRCRCIKTRAAINMFNISRSFLVNWKINYFTKKTILYIYCSENSVSPNEMNIILINYFPFVKSLHSDLDIQSTDFQNVRESEITSMNN